MRATGTRVVETETIRRDVVWLRPRQGDNLDFVARSAKVRGGFARCVSVGPQASVPPAVAIHPGAFIVSLQLA